MLVRLINTAPSQEALIHIYADRVVLNSRAVKLLDLRAGDRINITYPDNKDLVDGKRRVYIGRVSDGGFPTLPKGKCCRISSASLARALANELAGAGTYKISDAEVEYDFYHRPYYNIFWKRYDRQ